MYKRQHYALEHSARDSASSDSSSSLDTSSDADSGDPEQSDDEGAWPASSHESDGKSDEDDVGEVQSSASVAERRAEAILVAERKLAEAAEDLGEFEDGADRDDDKSKKIQQSKDEAESPDAEGSDESEGDSDEDGRNGTVPKGTQADSDSHDDEAEELLAQRKISNQWAEAVDEDDLERAQVRAEGNTVLCVGDESKVLKCKICPKIICLNEETMQTHLASKRHARSLKQLAEGRLKIKLDSDGEEEEEGETHAERHARTVAVAQEAKEKPTTKRKRDSGRQRQRRREKAKKAKSQSGSVIENGIEKNRKQRRALLQATAAGRDNAESVNGSKKGAKESGTEGKAGGRSLRKKGMQGGTRVLEEVEPKSNSGKKAKEGDGKRKAEEKKSTNMENGVRPEAKSKRKNGGKSSPRDVNNGASRKKKRSKLV